MGSGTAPGALAARQKANRDKELRIATMGSLHEKNSTAVRKRIETHTFEDEEGDEYEGSKFGGFSDYFRRKKIKLQNLDADVRRSSSANPKIFRGIVAHINGYTQPSLNDLHHLIVSHGGGFMQYLDGKTTVTHIIASNLTPKKAIEFKRYRIVKPAWVVDSVNAGKLLPWSDYRVLDEGVGQRVLAFDNGQVSTQATKMQRGYRDQTNTSWYTSQVKNVAEDIDDDEGPQFPRAQVQAIMSNKSGGPESADQPLESVESVGASNRLADDDDLVSSGAYDVTSSLEDALNQAVSLKSSARIASDPMPKTLELLSDQHSTPRVQLQRANFDRSSNVVSKASEKLHDRRSTPRLQLQKADFDKPSLVPSKALKIPTDRLSSPKVQPLQTKSETSSVNIPSNSNPSIATRKRSREPESPSVSKRARILTAEEHNAILLADPHMRKSSTANPDFIKQYYAESRLHHLSAWKADLKARFQQLAAEKSASQKPTKRKAGSRRYVLHVDFDSFFCAVSLKSAPEYVDKPAVVAHSSGSGSEIASCNYVARAFGVKNGMWMKNALKLCPDIKVLPYDFPGYEEASKGFYEAILDVGGIVQSVSVDEALVDISSLCLTDGDSDGFGVPENDILREQTKADRIGETLRERIREKTGCAVSVGIGGNILLAKLALRKAKPAGQHQIKPEEILNFIAGLGVQDLPGVAYSIGGKLEELGVKLVKDVRQLSKDRLMTILGPKTGEKMWEYSRGIDNTEVGEQVVRKSVSAEVNWGIRFISQPEAEEFVQNLCNELQRRLIEQNVKGKQITMKIMRKAADAPMDPPKNLGHGKCDTFNKSIILGVATNSGNVIGREAISVLRSYGFSPGELRGLGVQMTKLEPIKTSMPLGSQRRINFGTSVPPKLPGELTDDSIVDPETPTKQVGSLMKKAHEKRDFIDDTPIPSKLPVAKRSSGDDDPIAESSPLKMHGTPVHPAVLIARANAKDNSARKLNLIGNQFIIPTQMIPEVLDALPQDIRTKLMAQSKARRPRELSPFASKGQSPTVRNQSPAASQDHPLVPPPKPISRAVSPLPSQLDPEVFDALPEDLKAEILASYKVLPSQLDPEVFGALPDDMKAEILASYKAQPAGVIRGQSILPQSPRKVRTLQTSRRPVTPRKRGRGRPAKFSRQEANQSSFVSSRTKVDRDTVDPAPDIEDEEALDPDFLSALPPEMRHELLDEQRRKRLAKRGGLVPSHKPKRRGVEAPIVGLRRLRLPERPARPTFTTAQLSDLGELREMIGEWYGEFEAEGPNDDDVKALERYLTRVVGDERDTGKAVSLIKWLDFLIGDGEYHMEWEAALEEIKKSVQEAVLERGRGRLDL